uniref:Uncharacterized protein n=1 Tax=Arundo donax TaxID=35708 RepID=A0A0A9FYZ5_ARUDO
MGQQHGRADPLLYMLPGRRRKSLRLQAASLPARSNATVKEEMDDDNDVKPYIPNVLPSHGAVKVEPGEREGKPNISAGKCKHPSGTSSYFFILCSTNS